MTEKYTVGQLKELLSKYDDDVMISIEDMDGNAFYTAIIFAKGLAFDIIARRTGQAVRYNGAIFFRCPLLRNSRTIKRDSGRVSCRADM